MGDSYTVEGKVYPLGDDVNCDSIIPVRYCIQPTVDVLKDNCLTMIDPDFPFKASKGVIIVAGRNFGWGSSNENSVRALQLSGVKAVIAESLARIFQRNAINIGFVAVECPEIRESVVEDQAIKIDLDRWIVTSDVWKKSMKLNSMSAIEKDILASGDLIGYIKHKRMS